MSTLHWSDGVLPVLDFETTGTDPQVCRPVSVAFRLTTPKGHILPGSYAAIVNAGVDVPEEAAAIHGLTTERVRAAGVGPHIAVAEIVTRVQGAFYLGMPLLIYNAAFDWPLLHAEAARFALAHEIPDVPLVDPLVLDRHFNRYRKGGHKLADACAAYGVSLTEAHDADADAAAVGDLLRRMMAAHPELREWTLDEWQERQRAMHAEWVEGMNAYFARVGREDRIEDTPWPGVRVEAPC